MRPTPPLSPSATPSLSAPDFFAFGKTDDLWSFGKPSGWGAPWWKTPVADGEAGDPYLMTGFDKKCLHKRRESGDARMVRVDVDLMGCGEFTRRRALTSAQMWTWFVHMKTATVRDLRNNFGKLETWLAAGERIEIRRRGKPVATLEPAAAEAAEERVELPDFEARRKAIWGDRVFSAEEVRRMREMELEGEEG